MSEIRVRVETGMIGVGFVGQVVTLTDSDHVRKAIDDGRLTPVDEAAPVLRGDALDRALRDRELPTGGTADEKRARVAEYDAAQRAAEVPGLPAGGPAPLGGAVPGAPGTPGTGAGTPSATAGAAGTPATTGAVTGGTTTGTAGGTP